MISNLKDLQHVLKLCRKYGVIDMDLGSIKLKLGEDPKRQDDVGGDEDVQTDELTNDQLAFFSAIPPGS